MRDQASPTVLIEQRLVSENGRVQKLQTLSPALMDYVYERSLSPDSAMQSIEEAAQNEPMGFMQTAPDQTALLYMLAKISGARSVLEIGCYLGHSALALLAAMPADGRLIALDHNPDWAARARTSIAAAGFGHQFDLRIGKALESLSALAVEKAASGTTFDLVFIDADKVNALNYYDRVTHLVRPGGLIIVDNVLWRGHVADATDQSVRAVALRALNDFVHADPRVESLILTVSDGMLVARVKGEFN